MNEMLCGVKLEDIPEEHQENLKKLLEKINIVRQKWGKPMTPTNSYRTMKHHLEIYKAKGITDPAKIPMKSKHLYGLAVDIADPKLELTEWLKNNPEILEEVDGYCEEGNSNWVHMQIKPFGSYHSGGTRWFKP
jgi:uncharacterized protein YcbK (DUF882 family)